jgi:CheY-like chemotaxis protein
MTSTLEANGMQVVYAESGRDGIDALARHPDVNIVLMDIMMPGMDGYETIKLIRSDTQYKALPIIAVTAKALKDDRDRCLAAGASDYLSKPVDVSKLLGMINLWCNSSAGPDGQA